MIDALPLDEINRPEVVAEVTAVFDAYEQAFMRNDVSTLLSFFWNSDALIRYGIADVQYGFAAQAAFRRAAPPPTFTRRLEAIRITTFGRDAAVAFTEFVRSDTDLRGFQSQTWIRFAVGWRVVAAHVSMIAPPA